MPVCRDCQGAGQVEVKQELTQRCPDCDGTKQLSDGTACRRCDQWGEIGTGEFETIGQKLCRTCMGSGKISEGSVTVWFLIRVVPLTLILLGAGGALIWAAWTFLDLPWVTTLLIVLVFGLWGGSVYYFVGQMPNLGEISATNWLLIRAIPTTVSALPIGGALTWVSWFYLQNAPVTAIIALSSFLIWGALMFYFISHLPE